MSQHGRDLTTCVPPELQSMAAGFLARRITDVELLNVHLSAKDFTAIAGVAHRLKGNGTGYGFPAISGVGEDLELAVVTKDLRKIRQLIDELQQTVFLFQLAVHLAEH